MVEISVDPATAGASELHLTLFETGNFSTVQPRIDEVRAVSRVQPWTILGAGLLLAATTAALPLLFGHEVLEAAKLELDLPVLGAVKLSSTLAFDLGVFLLVVGLVLMVFEAFGDDLAQADRRREVHDGVAAVEEDREQPAEAADGDPVFREQHREPARRARRRAADEDRHRHEAHLERRVRGDRGEQLRQAFAVRQRARPAQ